MQCKAIKRDGERCGVDWGLNKENELCWHHDNTRADERRRATSLGGRNAAEKSRRAHARTVHIADQMAPPTTAAEAMRWASWSTWAVSVGHIDKGTAQQVNSGVRTFLQALDKAEMEAELAELKAKVKELQKGSRRS
ncbi:MAG: hypothetical protein WEA09_13040 [Gemmatimonadota bacterium]